MPILDHLVYTFASSYQFGFLTRTLCFGEPYDNSFGSGSYGHGRAAGGILTVNDSMYSLTTGETFDRASSRGRWVPRILNEIKTGELDCLYSKRYSSEEVVRDLAAFLNRRIVRDPNSPL